MACKGKGCGSIGWSARSSIPQTDEMREISGFTACATGGIPGIPDGETMFVQTVYLEDGTFERYIGHPIDGALPIVDPLLRANFSDCAVGELSIGYMEFCDLFNITVPVNQAVVFSDNTGPTNTISGEASTITLLAGTLRDAQEVNRQQVRNGVAVTSFVITDENGETYSFPPLAATITGATLIEIDQAQVVSWPATVGEQATSLTATVLSNCDCLPVELLQRVNPDFTVDILGIFDPSHADIATGAKLQLPFPPEVGTALPRPGPCPPRTQVIDFFDLCCNDDLLTSDPALAALGLAWLDGDNVNLMHPAGGGGPPAADGDNVVQIDDALGGIIPIALETVPATNTGPTLVVDSVNGRSVLDFNGTTDRLRLDTGAAAGGDFTFFALMSTTDAVTANAAIISVGANNADGDNYAFDQGSWQVSRGNLDDAFVFRFKTDFATEAAAAPVYTTKLFNAPNEGHSGPGPLTSSYDVGVIEWAAFNDGALHSIAVSFEAATSILKIWFDGELRVEGDFGAFAVSMAALGNDFFRFFGNRLSDAYTAGQLSEIFYANNLLTAEQTSAMNAYLICKWGIDPSQAVGGAGDLTLAESGIYSSPTPFRYVRDTDGREYYLNVSNGLEFPAPPVPGLSICRDEDCACYAEDGVIEAPTIQRVNNAGNIPNSRIFWQITNIGTADGTVGGTAIPPGFSIRSLGPIMDTRTNTFRRQNGIAYDATGTEFIIEEIND